MRSPNRKIRPIKVAQASNNCFNIFDNNVFHLFFSTDSDSCRIRQRKNPSKSRHRTAVCLSETVSLLDSAVLEEQSDEPRGDFDLTDTLITAHRIIETIW